MRTCNTCGKSIDHMRADAKFCDATCKSKRGPPSVPTPAPTPAVASAPLQTDPVFSDLGAALAGAPSPHPAPGGGDTRPVSPSHVEPRGSAADPDGCIAADVADLHKRLDRGLARLDERPTKAEVAAMIKAALAPVQKDIDRVDRTTAGAGDLDELQQRIGDIEAQLRGEADGPNDRRAPDPGHALPARIVELEKAIWGWPATEAEDSPRIEEGDPAYVTGRLAMLEHRLGILREEHDQSMQTVSAALMVINTVVSNRLGIELGPMYQRALAKVKKDARKAG